MNYESTPVCATIEIRKTRTNHWGYNVWEVILWEGQKLFEREDVVEDGGFWFWSFESRLKKTQKVLLVKYKLVKELSGPIFIKHG